MDGPACSSEWQWLTSCCSITAIIKPQLAEYVTFFSAYPNWSENKLTRKGDSCFVSSTHHTHLLHFSQYKNPLNLFSNHNLIKLWRLFHSLHSNSRVAHPLTMLVSLVFSLTSVTGVPRVVAVVAGDPQDPVLYVVHSVGCHFDAAVHRSSAAPTGRGRLARQVRVLQGLEADARLFCALQNALGAHHCRTERAQTRRDRRWAPRSRMNNKQAGGERPNPLSHSFGDAPGRSARLPNSRSAADMKH